MKINVRAINDRPHIIPLPAPGTKDVGAATCRPENVPLTALGTKDVGAAIGRPENVPLTALGIMVKQAILDIPKHYPAITVDHSVIMPNHIHLLLQIHTDADGRPMAAPTISTVINQTKGIISKKVGFSVWQKGFYDHVIRSGQDYWDIWNYIEGNPGKWAEDKLCISDSR